MKIITTLSALAAIIVGGVGNAAPGDEDFLAMREAFRVGDTRKLDLYAPKLKGHVLEPYAAYWQLRSRLDAAAPETVRAFLAEYKDTFVAERMRSDWLKRLGRSQQWDLFEAERAQLIDDDIDITCLALQSRARTDATAVREARSLWFTEKDTPESCAPLFNALAASNQLSAQDVWGRVRMALAAGQVGVASRAAAYLPAGQAPNAALLSAVSQSPAAHLARPFDAASRAARETTMFAAYRLARSSPQQASAHWLGMEAKFTEEERAFVWGHIGLQGALRHDPQTLAWYAKAGDMNDYQLEWKARAALRAGDWKTLIAAVDVMVKEGQDAPWRYWKARALKTQGRDAEALALLKPLSQEFSFYGQLALEDLGGKISAPTAGHTPTAADIQAMSQHPGIRRALAMYALNMRGEAVREWMWTLRDLDDRKLLAVAEVAKRADLPDRVINTAEKTVSVHDFRLRYFAPYRDVLTAHAAKQGLDEAWVLGLIRQESRFMADVRSSAGAMGLMQLMPGTAQWVAGKMGLKNWRWGNVTDVDTNISLGTYYLKHVLDYLDGNPALASAAYNAGPGRARAWRPDRAMETAAWAETIPFNETRHYVKLVMANASYYASLLSQQAQSLKSRIGEVGPARPAEKSLGDTP
ncbi:MAG: transglycosylase SLT domain-containing protein [Burkholderiales bacterium]